jgi:imidazolonepropionase-like amidohydrolase
MHSNAHSYETVDYNNLAQLTNQFKFRVSTIHHAHEAYLTIPRLKQFFQGPPSVAVFSTFARYKLEAFRGSEYAPYILTEAGIMTTCVSDHPVINSQYLLFEAQQTYMYGLNMSAALKTVTVNPAKALGLDHRMGKIGQGFDADIVVWDSMPLQLGARPVQVYIDGIAQLDDPKTVLKPHLQEVPPAGSAHGWKTALETRGDPPLRSHKTAKNVAFTGVSATYLRSDNGIKEVMLSGSDLQQKRVIIIDGRIDCVGDCPVDTANDFDIIDLKGGAITAGLLTYGSYLGLMEIQQERSTTDGKIPDVFGESNAFLSTIVSKGADGALFDQR